LEGSGCDVIELLAQTLPAGIKCRITRAINQDMQCPVRDTNGEFPEDASRACYVITLGLYVITRLSGPHSVKLKKNLILLRPSLSDGRK
jgi:hypothetical protein